ncbi:hypothetical protein [Acinetobacter pittii]|nr:hypothetical protein [Acinetobacter pittii]MBJ9706864.1 hypothetical protein [Acinetobacter baumannii]MCF1281359.1 hypothetical protein [Acinetobacter pittii]HCJ6432356.1 hypothetical protein [Acinetobacter baumannii]HCJ7465076.1 hypothetical protein [Acinetobacter baumannii]HCJ7822827.1 hypothetical protein [Acinetobacter baumannii]
MAKRMKTLPPEGAKKVRDWIGKRVTNTRDFESYSQKMPANSKGTVTDAGNGCGLRVTFDQCNCCGLQAIFTGVDGRDLQLIEVQNES